MRPGSQIGHLRFRVEGSELSEVPLYAVNSIDEDQRQWKRAWDSLKYLIFGG